MLAATPPNHWLGLLLPVVMACDAAAAGCPHPNESTSATVGTLIAAAASTAPPPAAFDSPLAVAQAANSAISSKAN